MRFSPVLLNILRSVPFWTAIVVVCVVPVLLVVAGYWAYEYEQNRRSEPKILSYGERLAHNINAIFTLNQVLAVIVRENQGNIQTAQMQGVLDAFLQDYSYLGSIQIAPEREAPLVAGKNNYGAPSTSFLNKDPVYRLDMRRSVEMNETMIIGPVGPDEETNEKSDLLVRTPVYFDGQPAHRFWGFIQATVAMDRLLRASGFEEMDAIDERYKIWRADWNSGSPVGIVSSSSPPFEDTLDYPIHLMTQQWWMTVEMRKNGSAAYVAFLCALMMLILSVLAAKRMITKRSSKKRLAADEAKRAERINRLSKLLAMYQDIFDSLDSGLEVWNKDQVLETWNFKFEKMYPVLSAAMRKGMTRNELRNIKIRDLELGVGQDWESLGTWYRQMPDGRIIMLKKTAMPDGGRLSMHTDMSKSLGDDDE